MFRRICKAFLLTLILFALAAVISSALVFYTRTVNVVHHDFPNQDGYVQVTDTAHLTHLEENTKYYVTAELRKTESADQSEESGLLIDSAVLDANGEPIVGSTMIDTSKMEYTIPYIEWYPFSGVYADVTVPIYIEETMLDELSSHPAEYSFEYDYSKYE